MFIHAEEFRFFQSVVPEDVRKEVAAALEKHEDRKAAAILCRYGQRLFNEAQQGNCPEDKATGERIMEIAARMGSQYNSGHLHD